MLLNTYYIVILYHYYYYYYIIIIIIAIIIRNNEAIEIHYIIQNELRTSNRLIGYRSMWKLLRDKYGIIVKRYGYIPCSKEILKLCG